MISLVLSRAYIRSALHSMLVLTHSRHGHVVNHLFCALLILTYNTVGIALNPFGLVPSFVLVILQPVIPLSSLQASFFLQLGCSMLPTLTLDYIASHDPL